jgi:hypothetical protein
MRKKYNENTIRIKNLLSQAKYYPAGKKDPERGSKRKNLLLK